MVGEKRFKKISTVTLLLLPGLVGLIAFNILPILYSAFISFTDWDGVSQSYNFVGINNFINIFQDDRSLKAFANTSCFIVFYIPFVLLFGLIFALLLDTKIRGIKFYRALIFIPVITSWVAVSLIWRWLYDESGVINYILSIIGMHGRSWLYDESTALFAVVIVTVWKDLGYIAIILLAGLQGISEDYYEAADIDGASPLQKLFYITIPALTPSIFFVLIISLINNFQIFDQIYIMTNGGPMNSTRSIVLELYDNAFQYGKVGFASAQAWVLFIVILIITVIQNKLQKRWVNYDT